MSRTAPFKFLPRTSKESDKVIDGIVFDYNEDNRVIGIEIEDASKLIK
jgi:uncharacterized protein YuzE